MEMYFRVPLFLVVHLHYRHLDEEEEGTSLPLRLHLVVLDRVATVLVVDPRCDAIQGHDLDHPSAVEGHIHIVTRTVQGVDLDLRIREAVAGVTLILEAIAEAAAAAISAKAHLHTLCFFFLFMLYIFTLKISFICNLFSQLTDQLLVSDRKSVV